MIKIILISVLFISSAVLGYLYLQIQKIENEVSSQNIPDPNAVRIVHSYKDDVHRFAGRIRLPHSCYTLHAEVRTDESDLSLQHIVLTATDNILEQQVCAQIPTIYPFEVLSEHSKDVTVALTLNGEKFPVRMQEVLWQSATGTYLNNGETDVQ